jgi:hypothetical protein
MKFYERREIFSPAKKLIAFQFVGILAGSGYCPVTGDYKQDEEDFDQQKAKRLLASSFYC